jgi:hypothetical protein
MANIRARYRKVAEWLTPGKSAEVNGYVWIDQDMKDGSLVVNYDPVGWMTPEGIDILNYAWGNDPNFVASIDNFMVINGTPAAEQVLAYWRSLGSPIIDRKAEGYQRQWLPFVLPFDADRWDEGATPNFQRWRDSCAAVERFWQTGSEVDSVTGIDLSDLEDLE